jgi:hypothetical protein
MHNGLGARILNNGAPVPVYLPLLCKLRTGKKQMNSAPSLRIGELLVACSLMEQQAVDQAMVVSVRTGLPLGRILTAAGQISQGDLEIALRLQKIVRSTSLPLAVAVEVFKYMKSDELTLEQALGKAGITGQIASLSKLGTLLVDAQLISKQQLTEAQKTSLDTGIPIGRTLCLMGVLSSNMLAKVLVIQGRMRDQKISRDEAVKLLHNTLSVTESNQGAAPAAVAKAKDMASGVDARGKNDLVGKIATRTPPDKEKIEQSLKDGSIESSSLNRVKLGQLLLMSGAVTEIDVMNALEVSLTENRTMGQVLVSSGVVPQSFLDHAVEMQVSIAAGSISIMTAVQSLGYIAKVDLAKLTVDTSYSELGNPIKLGELLKISEIAGEQDIAYALDLVALFPALIGKMLVVAGVIDEHVLLAALRCQFLLKAKAITLEDAVRGLKHAYANGVVLDDALEEIGVKI